MNTASIRAYFKNELRRENYVIGRDGSKTLELIGASFVADKPAIIGKPNEDYIARELEWYEKQSLNVNDIYGVTTPAPAAWRMTANDGGYINSNYGYLIYNRENYNQYREVRDELQRNPNSRRACMVYQRPSIWRDYNAHGKNDFICTNAVTYYIREDRLDCVVQMRSNDVVYGYKNDYAWQQHVLRRLAKELKVSVGYIHWQVQNLHVYERHFDMLRNA